MPAKEAATVPLSPRILPSFPSLFLLALQMFHFAAAPPPRPDTLLLSQLKIGIKKHHP
jgi:hypothetical protein